MAKENLAPLRISSDTAKAIAASGASAAVTAVDGAQIVGATGDLIIIAQNAGGDAATVTLAAGTGLQAWMKGSGNLAFSVAAGGTSILGPLETARFEESGGTIQITVSATVTITVLRTT